MTRILLALGILASLLEPGAAGAAPKGAHIALSCAFAADPFCGRLLAELQAAGHQVDKLPDGADLEAELAAPGAVVQVRQSPWEVAVLVRRDGVLETRTYRPDASETNPAQTVAVQVAEGLRASFAERAAEPEPPAAQPALEPAPAPPSASQVPVAVAAPKREPAPSTPGRQPTFFDAATVGEGHLLASSATRVGSGFAGYFGMEGPLPGQTLDVLVGLTDWFHLGLSGALAHGGTLCADGPVRSGCYELTYVSGSLRLGLRLFRSASDRFQLGVEIAGNAFRVPDLDPYLQLGGTAAVAASSRIVHGWLLVHARAGWDYKVRPDDTRYGDNGPIAGVAVELARSRVHPFIESAFSAPDVSWRRERYVAFSLALGVTGVFL